MRLLLWLFDSLLGLSLLWLAWWALNCADLFRAIVLFIAFGLLMALAWVRLEAPDVALAEAAIGAGLTGALLMAAFAKLQQLRPSDGQPLDGQAQDTQPIRADKKTTQPDSRTISTDKSAKDETRDD